MYCHKADTILALVSTWNPRMLSSYELSSKRFGEASKSISTLTMKAVFVPNGRLI